MILGFTGTRRGMTTRQRNALPGVLSSLPAQLLHGGAPGADEEMDSFLAPLFLEPGSIQVYPGDYGREDYWKSPDRPFSNLRRIWPAVHYLKRNWIITYKADRLLATPETDNEVLRSGTWATIRYARRLKKPITIISPDGSITEES